MARITHALLIAAVLLPGTGPAHGSWPSFRGPAAAGIAEGGELPVTWSVETGENVRWSTEVPGLGHSSPIVWENQVLLTTAVPLEGPVPELRLGDSGGIDAVTEEGAVSWLVLALDADTGELRWSREAVRALPAVGHHVKASLANATPATDGSVLAAILGSRRLYAFDLDGRPRWDVDLGLLDPGLYGDPTSQWGYASSPVVAEGLVFVQVLRHRDSYVAAYDARSGGETWRVDVEERPAWSTPTLVEGPRGTVLVVVGSLWVRGLDPATGAERWRFADETEVRTPTPFVADGKIVVAGGYRGRPIHALPLAGRGEVSAVWSTDKGGPYTSTPVAWGELLFSVADEGILNVWRLADGERVHRRRLDEHFSASLLAAGGRVYLFGEGGDVIVLDATAEATEIARMSMGEPIIATPAVAHGRLYLRSRSRLWALERSSAGPADGPGRSDGTESGKGSTAAAAPPATEQD